jgi:hypothetical protein
MQFCHLAWSMLNNWIGTDLNKEVGAQDLSGHDLFPDTRIVEVFGNQVENTFLQRVIDTVASGVML